MLFQGGGDKDFTDNKRSDNNIHEDAIHPSVIHHNSSKSESSQGVTFDQKSLKKTSEKKTTDKQCLSNQNLNLSCRPENFETQNEGEVKNLSSKVLSGPNTKLSTLSPKFVSTQIFIILKPNHTMIEFCEVSLGIEIYSFQRKLLH